MSGTNHFESIFWTDSINRKALIKRLLKELPQNLYTGIEFSISPKISFNDKKQAEEYLEKTDIIESFRLWGAIEVILCFELNQIKENIIAPLIWRQYDEKEEWWHDWNQLEGEWKEFVYTIFKVIHEECRCKISLMPYSIVAGEYPSKEQVLELNEHIKNKDYLKIGKFFDNNDMWIVGINRKIADRVPFPKERYDIVKEDGEYIIFSHKNKKPWST